MSEVRNHDEIWEYVLDSKYGLLNYVRGERTPISRATGSFTLNGTDLYFSTGKDTAKVREIGLNKRVSFYFEHDNQAVDAWKSVLLIGDAELVQAGSKDYNTAVERLSAKSPRFRERVAKGDLESAAIFRVRTKEIEYLDRSKGYGFVQKIDV